MIFAKRGLVVHAVNFGPDIRRLIYDGIITVKDIGIYDLMTKKIVYKDKEYKDIIEFIDKNNLYNDLAMFNISAEDHSTLYKVSSVHAAEYGMHEITCESGEVYLGYYIPNVETFVVDLSEKQYLRMYAQRYDKAIESSKPLKIGYVGAIPKDAGIDKEKAQEIISAAKTIGEIKTLKDILSAVPLDEIYLDVDGVDGLMPLGAREIVAHGIQTFSIRNKNYLPRSIIYDKQLGKYRTPGGDTFKAIREIKPE